MGRVGLPYLYFENSNEVREVRMAEEVGNDESLQRRNGDGEQFLGRVGVIARKQERVQDLRRQWRRAHQRELAAGREHGSAGAAQLDEDPLRSVLDGFLRATRPPRLL